MQLQYWNGKVVSNYESCSESDFEDVQLSRVRTKGRNDGFVISEALYKLLSNYKLTIKLM